MQNLIFSEDCLNWYKDFTVVCLLNIRYISNLMFYYASVFIRYPFYVFALTGYANNVTGDGFLLPLLKRDGYNNSLESFFVVALKDFLTLVVEYMS